MHCVGCMCQVLEELYKTDKHLLEMDRDILKVAKDLQTRVEALENQLRENHAPAKEGKNAKE